MFEPITMNLLTQPKVAAMVDILRALQTTTTNLKNNLMIFASVATIAFIVVGGLFSLSGRRGAKNGKTRVGYMLMGVGVILGAASIITLLSGLFGQTP